MTWRRDPRAIWRDPRAVNLTGWQPPVTYDTGYYLNTGRTQGHQVGVVLAHRDQQRYDYHRDNLLRKAEAGLPDPVFG